MNYKYYFMNGDNNAGKPIVLKERIPLQHPSSTRSFVTIERLTLIKNAVKSII